MVTLFTNFRIESKNRTTKLIDEVVDRRVDKEGRFEDYHI